MGNRHSVACERLFKCINYGNIRAILLFMVLDLSLTMGCKSAGSCLSLQATYCTWTSLQWSCYRDKQSSHLLHAPLAELALAQRAMRSCCLVLPQTTQRKLCYNSSKVEP